MKNRTLTTLAGLAGGAAVAAAAADAPPVAAPTGPNDGRVERLRSDKDLADLARSLGLPETMFGGAAAVVDLDADAYNCSTTVVVEINLEDPTVAVAGGQFFLEYDNGQLDFVSIEPAATIYTNEVYEVVDESAGTIDYAVGVPVGAPPSGVEATMAVITFEALGDFCFTENLVTFGTGPASGNAITDGSGSNLTADFVDLGFIAVDTTDPVATAPADVTVNADVGGCTWTPKVLETFDDAVDACETGCDWIVDRYAPAVFEQDTSTWAPDNTLRHGVAFEDSETQRPGGFSSAFYNWQGYKQSVDIPQGSKLAADVYIPATWAGMDRVASLWGQNSDTAGFISGFPVLAFNGNVSGSGDARFRLFSQDTDEDSSNGFQPGWRDMVTVAAGDLDRWFRFEIELGEGTNPVFTFRVTDLSTDTVVAELTDAGTFDSVKFTDVFLQLYNFGDDYETHWDDVLTGGESPVVTDCVANVSYERSDDAALTINDPFPSGTTTITWTVEDACGRVVTVDQDVTVDPVHEFAYNVRMATGATSFTLPMVRCLTFTFAEVGCGSTVEVTADVVFDDNGSGVVQAFGTIDIPCGDYDCVSVRDSLHTLPSIDGNDFVVLPGFGYSAGWEDPGEELVSGNLNDDLFIDILDFGILIGQFGSGSGGTDCTTVGPDADIDADGTVDIADFSFIQINFLATSNAVCCPAPALGPGGPVRGPRVDPRDPRASVQAGPLRSISVRELRRRGLGHLEPADLNRDGWLDEMDIAAFLDGARP